MYTLINVKLCLSFEVLILDEIFYFLFAENRNVWSPGRCPGWGDGR